MQNLIPIRAAVEKVAVDQPELRDCFLCHAWPDRQGSAKDLDDALKAAGVKTWFSEMDLPLGAPMMRTIDRGLANSRIGLVLVTPAFIKGLPNQGVADTSATVATPAPPTDLTVPATAASAGPAAMTWQGPSRAKVGETFALQLTMQSDQPVVSLPMALGFDPRALQVPAPAFPRLRWRCVMRSTRTVSVASTPS